MTCVFVKEMITTLLSLIAPIYVVLNTQPEPNTCTTNKPNLFFS